MVSPALLLQLARRQVLVGSALLEVEDEEEGVHGQALEQKRVVEDGSGNGGEIVGRVVGFAREIGLRAGGVEWVGQMAQRGLQLTQTQLRVGGEFDGGFKGTAGWLRPNSGTNPGIAEQKVMQ
jgi:hypothetical protein